MFNKCWINKINMKDKLRWMNEVFNGREFKITVHPKIKNAYMKCFLFFYIVLVWTAKF